MRKQQKKKIINNLLESNKGDCNCNGKSLIRNPKLRKKTRKK